MSEQNIWDAAHNGDVEQVMKLLREQTSYVVFFHPFTTRTTTTRLPGL